MSVGELEVADIVKKHESARGREMRNLCKAQGAPLWPAPTAAALPPIAATRWSRAPIHAILTAACPCVNQEMGPDWLAGG
jgi:hypothetical protein